MRVCGFCGGLGVNKEHVWPDWLRLVILESRAQGGMKHFHAEIERGRNLSRFAKPSLEIEVGMPCSSCNSGWMSIVENNVKSFMRTMVFRGEQTLLDQNRQLALTRWILKTAMVYEFTAAPAEAKYFTESERLTFKNALSLPSNVWIWLGRYDGVRPLHAVQQRAPNATTSPPRVYSLTFTANFLAIQVFAFRESEGSLDAIARATKAERLTQLHPAPGAWLTWPPPITIDDEALEVLDYRFVNVLRSQ